ncbi:diiron oxygenase [Streptomyces sp. NPDC059853]|uniref:diiron oxygenase n=1 Tax=Streptomyces sp. NPDC059853 TaxID=3346973 RepID=UPI0036574EC2
MGLFVGCSALSYCPRDLLAQSFSSSPETDGGAVDEEYRSPFRTWYERASVRHAPRRILEKQPDEFTYFFPPELVPIAQHSLVQALPPPIFEQVLIQHLYRYLDFTAKLEYLVVNRTILGIAHGSVRVDMPDEMRFDALKMYCDEAYHSLFSVDLARQVHEQTGIAARLPERPYFLRRLELTIENAGPDLRNLTELLFVIVSETLISATLAEIPSGHRVVPVVRDTIRDHALDEGRHHAYFATLLRRLWGQLAPTTRHQAALLTPSLIDAFLRPDIEEIRKELHGYGLGRDDTEQVIGEVLSERVVQEHTALTAQQTVRYFESVGALEIPEVREEFYKYGLVTG